MDKNDVEKEKLWNYTFLHGYCYKPELNGYDEKQVESSSQASSQNTENLARWDTGRIYYHMFIGYDTGTK